MKKILLLLTGIIFASHSLAESNVNQDDPWESWNRKVFVFNDTLDTYALKPIAKGYRAVTPDPVETSISRVFSNLGEVITVVNDLLQGKLSQAANDTGRVLINSTFGLAGIFEVADGMGLEKSYGEDFDQTLAVWGVGQGNYLILPFLGPSSVRGVPGKFADSFVNPIGYVDHVPTRNTLYGTELISMRADLLDIEKLASGDKYTFMRDVYLQRREFLINDGDVEDDFGGYGDEYQDEEY